MDLTTTQAILVGFCLGALAVLTIAALGGAPYDDQGDK